MTGCMLLSPRKIPASQLGGNSFAELVVSTRSERTKFALEEAAEDVEARGRETLRRRYEQTREMNLF